MYACICHNLSERRLRQAVIDLQACTPAADLITAVQARTGACTGCGCCADYVALKISETTGVSVEPDALRPQALPAAV